MHIRDESKNFLIVIKSQKRFLQANPVINSEFGEIYFIYLNRLCLTDCQQAWVKHVRVEHQWILYLSNLICLLKQKIEWDHPKNQRQTIDLMIVEIMLCHNLVVEMIWHLTIVKFIKDYDIELFNLKVTVHKMILEDFWKEQKYIIVIEISFPLFRTYWLITLFDYLRFVQRKCFIHDWILSWCWALRELLFQSSGDLCSTIILSCYDSNLRSLLHVRLV